MDLYAIQKNDKIIDNPRHALLRRPIEGSSAQAPDYRLVITTKTQPRDAIFGFRHGRDPDSLILIGERRDRVSRRQFDIVAKPTGELFIYNRSEHGTMIQFGQNPAYFLKEGSVIPDDEEHLHIMAPVEMHIFLYPRAGRPEWERFCAELTREVPVFDNFRLRSSTFVTKPTLKRSSSFARSSEKRRKVYFSPLPTEATQGASSEDSRSSISKLDYNNLSCRLLFQPGSRSLTARGGTWVNLHPRNNKKSQSVMCLAMDQTSLDVRCDVYLPFPCRFYYYPFKDAVEFYNASGSVVTVQPWGRSAPLYIKKGCSTALEPGPWKLRDQSGIEFQVLVRPRQYSVELLDASGSAIQSPDISALVEHDSLKRQSLRVRDAEHSRSLLVVEPFLASNSMLICRGRLDFQDRPALKVLVKFLKSSPGGISSAAALWEKEYSILARLKRSDGILPLLLGEARLGILVFEDMSAWPVGHGRWCRSGSFSGTPSDVDRILQDVAKALRKLESMHVRHNSIHPMNVLYSRQTGAFLMGFETALPFAVKSLPGTLGSHPWYVSPERSEDKQDVRSDIWSLGILSMALLKLIPLVGLKTLSGWWDIHGSESAEIGQSRWLKIVETTQASVHGKPHWQAVGMMLQRMLEPDPRQRVSTDTLLSILLDRPVSMLSEELARDADPSRKIARKQRDRSLQRATSSRDLVTYQDGATQTSLGECDRGIRGKEM